MWIKSQKYQRSIWKTSLCSENNAWLYTVNHPMVENHLIVEISQKYEPNWPAIYFFLLSSGCKLNQKSFIQVLQIFVYVVHQWRSTLLLSSHGICKVCNHVKASIRKNYTTGTKDHIPLRRTVLGPIKISSLTGQNFAKNDVIRK